MFYYVGIMPYSSDLYHHGIKGQKWGIRRYQNEDGTLTNAGKERYGVEALNSNSHSLLRRIASRDYGPVKNSAIRGKIEEHLAKDPSKKQQYEAQKQKNIDYEKYTAKTSTGKLVAQRLLMTGFGARKYREARARGAGRIRSALSSSFFLTPVGFIATKVSEKKRYGAFVHSDVSSSDELYHFGIKGQKWGVRRYQNEDGTLTEEGKRRYRDNPELAKKDIKKNYAEAYNKAAMEVNAKIPELNKKWADVDFNKDSEAYERYVKEYVDMAEKIYSDVFDKEFGEAAEVSGLGRDWIKQLF